jgi:hypothetical protein
VDINKKRQCPQTPAGFFMNVLIVRHDLNQTKVIAVFFAVMAMFHALQFSKIKVVVDDVI